MLVTLLSRPTAWLRLIQYSRESSASRSGMRSRTRMPSRQGKRPGGGGRKASRPADEIEEHRALPELVDRGDIDAAGDRDERAHRRDVNHVAGEQLCVAGFVAREKQIVQVE